MVDRFVSYATGPALAPGEPGAVIRTGEDNEVEMVNLRWGLPPPQPGARPLTHLRSEGRSFGRRRCLVPGSQFTIAAGEGKARRKWRVTAAGRDSHFYFAGLWRPAEGDWPSCYAMITIPANPDIAPFHDRQVAVIRREQAAAWLDHFEPEAKLLAPLPKGSFRLEQVEGPPAAQAALALET